MRDIKFRCYDTVNKQMINDKNVNVLLKNINNNKSHIYQQFTGLIDKKGVEIYEGDILSISFMDDYPNQRSYVSFEDGGFKLKVKNGATRPMSDNAGWCELKRYGDIEVVGNIYENKELLGDK